MTSAETALSAQPSALTPKMMSDSASDVLSGLEDADRLLVECIDALYAIAYSVRDATDAAAHLQSIYARDSRDSAMVRPLLIRSWALQGLRSSMDCALTTTEPQQQQQQPQQCCDGFAMANEFNHTNRCRDLSLLNAVAMTIQRLHRSRIELWTSALRWSSSRHVHSVMTAAAATASAAVRDAAHPVTALSVLALLRPKLIQHTQMAFARAIEDFPHCG